MIWWRKVDYYGQLVLGVLMILSIPFLYFFGFLFGLAILGCWQIISAACNTSAFINSGLGNKISTYWLLTGIVLVIFFLGFFLPEDMNEGPLLTLGLLAILPSVGLAAYYSSIYYRLIENLSLRREVDGVTKSNH